METGDTKRSTLAAADVASLAYIAVIVVISGLIISLYAVFIKDYTLHKSSEEAVKQTASFVAQKMCDIAIDDEPEFGAVGLADGTIKAGKDQRHVTSLNRLYATIWNAHQAGEQAALPAVMQLARRDLTRLRNIETELRTRLQRLVSDNHLSSCLEQAHNIASQNTPRDESLIGLNIKLGHLQTADYDSGMPISGAQAARSAASNSASPVATARGNYVATKDLPFFSSGSIRFYQLASTKHTFCDPKLFVEAAPGETPSAVLVEAQFKEKDAPGNQPGTIKQRSIALLIGGADRSTTDSVFMISFPHGMLNTTNSLRTLMQKREADDLKPGQWQRAINGTVPGNGQLSSEVNTINQIMGRSEALQTAIYHWLRSLGPSADLKGLSTLIDYSWQQTPLQPGYSISTALETKTTAPHPRTALVRDTGSREFALLNQTSAGSQGQAILKNAFNAAPGAQSIPKAAFPLDIDKNGACNLAGRSMFDRKLILDFLTALYETNLAANESIMVARDVLNHLDNAQDQASRNINLLSEELFSVSGRRQRLEIPGKASAELTRLAKTEAMLSAEINAQRARRDEYKAAKERAELVLINAELAGQASYDICASISRYTEKGIFRCDNEYAFLLGDADYVFRPIRQTITEEEIFSSNRRSSKWLSDLAVLDSAPNDLVAEGKTAAQWRAEIQRNSVQEPPLQPRFVLFHSKQLADKQPVPIVLDASPFSDSGVPTGQMLFYQQNAFSTGSSPKLSWSLLIRDVVARTGSSASSQNLARIGTKWCWGKQGSSASPCPPLAVETQVRSPVPLIPDLPVGCILTNPRTHERMSQIPPVPASML